MIYGLDDRNIRVNARDANRGDKYRCPGCNTCLVLKHGEINIPHFAHAKRQKCDMFTENKMTLWHLNHQRYFQESEREVLLSHDGVTHIADVKTDDVIIEFQHSPISYTTFKERSQFYHRFGTLVWVFDLREKAENIDHTTFHWERKCTIACGDEENYLSNIKFRYSPCRHCEDNKGRTNTYFFWKHSSRMLGQCNYKALDESGLKCFFQIEENRFVRVKWNKDGVKCFSGDVMNIDGFHKYIESIK